MPAGDYYNEDWYCNHYDIRNDNIPNNTYTERMRLFYSCTAQVDDRGLDVQITGKTFSNAATRPGGTPGTPYNEDDYSYTHPETSVYSSINQGNGGGAILTGGLMVTLTNCVFAGNTAANKGGGLYIDEGFDDGTMQVDVLLTGCTFSNNMAQKGGALYATLNRPQYWWRDWRSHTPSGDPVPDWNKWHTVDASYDTSSKRQKMNITISGCTFTTATDDVYLNP